MLCAYQNEAENGPHDSQHAARGMEVVIYSYRCIFFIALVDPYEDDDGVDYGAFDMIERCLCSEQNAGPTLVLELVDKAVWCRDQRSEPWRPRVL